MYFLFDRANSPTTGSRERRKFTIVRRPGEPYLGHRWNRPWPVGNGQSPILELVGGEATKAWPKWVETGKLSMGRESADGQHHRPSGKS